MADPAAHPHRDRPARREDPLPRGRRGQAGRLRPRLPGRRPSLGRSRRLARRPLPLPGAGLADRRPADRDESGRRPLPLRDRGDDRRLPRGARPRGRDDRRQRQRRRDVAGARHPPPAADRPPRAHQLRHLRALPAGIFKAMPAIAKLPGGMSVLAAPFRVGALARAAFKPFSKRGIPAELVASWMEPSMNDAGVRRDLKKVTVGMNKRYTLEAAEKLRGSELPILLAWAPGDRLFPLRTAERLAAEVGQCPHRRDRRLEHVRPDRPAPARRRRDRRLHRLKEGVV